MEVMLGMINSNSLERVFDNVINCPDRHHHFESLPNREILSQTNEIRNNDNRNDPVRQNGLAESIEILSR